MFYQIKADDQTVGYANGGLSVGAVITYCEENFETDVDVFFCNDEQETRDHVAHVVIK